MYILVSEVPSIQQLLDNPARPVVLRMRRSLVKKVFEAQNADDTEMMKKIQLISAEMRKFTAEAGAVVHSVALLFGHTFI